MRAARRDAAPLVFWPLAALFVLVDVAFLFANMREVHGRRVVPDRARHRGVHPAAHLAARPRSCCRTEILKDGIQLDTFLPGLMLAPPVRVPGTAVFLTAQKGIVPKALLHNLKHNKVLHERNVLLTVETKSVPFVAADTRLTIETDRRRLLPRDHPLRLHGNAGRAAGADALRATSGGMCFDPMDTTYFASRETHRRQPPPRHADLARQAVRRHAPQRGAGHGFLPHSGDAAGRARRAGRDLISSWAGLASPTQLPRTCVGTASCSIPKL